MISIAKDAANEDKLMEIVLESGAEDLNDEGEHWEILCDPKDFEAVTNALKAAKIPTETAEVTKIASTYTKLEGAQANAMMQSHAREGASSARLVPLLGARDAPFGNGERHPAGTFITGPTKDGRERLGLFAARERDERSPLFWELNRVIARPNQRWEGHSCRRELPESQNVLKVGRAVKAGITDFNRILARAGERVFETTVVKESVVLFDNQSSGGIADGHEGIGILAQSIGDRLEGNRLIGQDIDDIPINLRFAKRAPDTRGKFDGDWFGNG